MMSHTNEIQYIFSDKFIEEKSFALWERHLHWLATLGWDAAYRRGSTEDLAGLSETAPSGHEVVDLLARFITRTGYINAHAGLTSSDIIDNVRLMQVNESMKVVAAAVAPMMMRLNARFNLPNVETVGFTHWQVAAPISWAHRLHAWLEPINYLLATRPAIHAKKFGGPVGDAASLKLLVPSNVLDDNPFDWGPFDLDHPNNPFPLQSSDHTCESQAINWVCGLASQVHKIALDLRFLASQQLLTINRPAGHAGSSSMPHKLNPYKWPSRCCYCRRAGMLGGCPHWLH
jgi:adenylosuccinate lyase